MTRNSRKIADIPQPSADIQQKQKEENLKENGELSFLSKVCFALPGLTYQMYFCAIGVFVTIFLLEKAKIGPEKVTFILFTSRIIDAISDPIYGFFVDATKVTKYGKLKPWIILSIVPVSLSYMMSWYIPKGFSENQLFFWFIIWHSLFFIFATGIRIPHSSLTMFLSPSAADRDAATIYRMGSEMLGILLALGIQGPFVSTVDECIIPEKFKNETLINSTNETPNTIDTGFWHDEKYAIFAFILTAIFIVSIVLLGLFVKERHDLVHVDDKKQKTNVLKELKQMFTFKPFLYLFSAAVLSTFAFQVMK
jgi:Na+/melibiose symporter-like transporter